MSSSHALLMPKLGLTMTEGTLAEWLVSPGDAFAEGDILFVVETDKIANEIVAEAAGRLAEIAVKAGETVEVGALLGRVDYAGAGSSAGGRKPVEAPGVPSPPAAAAEAPQVARTPRRSSDRIVASPLARRMARQMGVELAGLAGSGPRGRIKATDVETAAANAASIPSGKTVKAVPAPEPRHARSNGRSIALGRVQQVAARRTTRSKSEIPHFYLAATVAVDELARMRAAVNEAGGWQKTTVTHWLTAAVGRALVDMPEANRVFDDGMARALDGSAVGVVADVSGDLFIPVVAGAGSISIGAIAAGLSALVERAGAGRLGAADMQGAAISISNLGMYGIDSVTPVIDLDQSMILGVGRPLGVFRPGPDGQPVAATEITLTLACDHRVHNGVSAARFLALVIDYIARPMRLLTAPFAHS